MEYSSTTQTIVWFRERYREGQLDLKKPYQRNPVWVERQKCSLIETILLGLPIPEIFVELSTSDDEGEQQWGVVDGQQRIRAILQFMGNEMEPGEESYNEFALDKLDAHSPYYGMTFRKLSTDAKRRFFETKLVVRELKPGSPEEITDMFKRLNKYLTPLNGQELRNATYTGPFARLAQRLANDEYWSENKIVTPSQIRRMKDVQFVSSLVIGVMHGPQGGADRIIDEYYAMYEDYDDEFPGQRDVRNRFAATLTTASEIFPDIKTTRWNNQTDFYTLFVGLATLLRTSRLAFPNRKKLAERLGCFAEEVDTGLADETANVSQGAVQYVRAVQKGANDKARRGDRHKVLLQVIQPLFTSKK